MKKFRKLCVVVLCAVLMTCLLVGCGGDNTVKATGVTLSKATLALDVGSSEKLIATVVPDDATNNSVSWSSSNEDVATVSRDGRVTGVSVGGATITVTTTDGGHKATCAVTVNAASATDVTLNTEKVSLALIYDTAYTLTATVEPEYAADKTVTWSSDKPSVATVSDSGTVTAVTEGEATITATTTDGGHKAACKVTVNQAIPVSTADGFAAIKNDRNGYYVLTADITLSGTWKSLGTLTGVLNGLGRTVTLDITSPVGNRGIFEEIAADGIVKNLKLDGTAQYEDWSGGMCATNRGSISNCIFDIDMTAAGTDTGYLGGIVGDHYAPGIVEYCIVLSEIKGMGTVAQNEWGFNGPGNGAIVKGVDSDTARGAMKNCYFNSDTVNGNGNVDSVKGKPLVQVALGEDAKSGVDRYPDMKKNTAQLKTASLYSGWDTNVWNIVNDQYPALKAVTVVEEPVSGVTLNKTAMTLTLFKPNGTLTATVAPANATNKAVMWSSSNTSVATVSNSGTVTALDEGTATITVTTVDGGLTADCMVTVVTVATPTAISTAEGFAAINDDLNGYYILTADFTLSGTWASLGEFTGILDGQGHTITLDITSPAGNKGIFNEIASDGIVKNLKLDGAAQYEDWSGGMVATNRGTISNCIFDVDMTAAGTDTGYLGGVVCDHYAPGIVEYCIVLSEIKGMGTMAQLEWGFNNGPGNGAIVKGRDSDTERGAMENCYYNTDTVNGADGSNMDTVKGKPLVQFALGEDARSGVDRYPDMKKDTAQLKTESLYSGWDTSVWSIVDGQYPALKAVTMAEVPASGVTLDKPTMTLTLLRPNGALTATVTPANATNKAVTWSSSNTSVATVDNAGAVTALDEGAATITVTTVDGGFTADCAVTVAPSNAITISTAEGFAAINDDLNGYYVLTADFTLSGTWASLGVFTGILDGQGHTITLDITSPAGNKGIFEELAAGGIVKNLKLDGAAQYEDWSGGMVKTNRGTISNCILDIDMTAAGTETGYLGGVVCDHYAPGIIEYCIVLSEIKGMGTMAQNEWDFNGPGNGAIAKGVDSDSERGAMENCYFNTDTVNGAGGSNVDTVKGKPLVQFALGEDTKSGKVDRYPDMKKDTAQLKSESLYSGWDTSVWSIVDGQYPALKVTG